jgi:protein TonB
MGVLISTTEDTIRKPGERMPFFSDCQDTLLTGKDLQDCSNEGMYSYIYGNIKYPRKSRMQGIEGRAVVRFEIDKDGSVANVKMLSGVSKEISEEVLSIMHSMPAWKPGMHEGKPIKVTFTLPILFKLE